jgi:small GTP-binding protein
MSRSKLLKIITTGDEGVGKTTFLYRYVKGKFLTNTKATLGVDFLLKKYDNNGKQLELQLWDFAGQNVYRHILKSYTSGASGALLLFDLTNPSSLEKIDEWVDICREKNPKLPIIFLGAKLDLIDSTIIEDKDARFYKEKYGFLDYIKVSSKTDENVDLAFQLLVEEITKDL